MHNFGRGMWRRVGDYDKAWQQQNNQLMMLYKYFSQQQQKQAQESVTQNDADDYINIDVDVLEPEINILSSELKEPEPDTNIMSSELKESVVPAKKGRKKKGKK